MYNYIIGFSVYTLAMIGIIFIGFVLVKKCSMARKGAKSHNNFLEIETSLSIEPRKTIHVIRAGGEKILLATDAERTVFLTKLGGVEGQNVVSLDEWKSQKEASYDEFEEVDIFDVPHQSQQTVFKDLMKRLQK
ncbi:MAG: flagellar biosynthetic protein FliO [Candidatus Gastranaerophilales bacterium]|nr:flagellar biosynthetic protein FliO [Candidatus Gastranaerophilales bacterium]